MGYVTPIIVAILGSTFLSAIITQLIGWRASLRGESQFTSWNIQIREIERLDKAASEKNSRIDGIAMGWVVAARAEAISSISKRLVPSRLGLDIFLMLIGSLALLLGISIIILIILNGVPEGSQGPGVLPSIVLICTGVLGLFTSAANERTISSVRNKISTALHCNLDGNLGFQDGASDKGSEKINEVSKFEQIWLGSDVANTANRLISELRHLNSGKRPKDGVSESVKK